MAVGAGRSARPSICGVYSRGVQDRRGATRSSLRSVSGRAGIPSAAGGLRYGLWVELFQESVDAEVQEFVILGRGGCAARGLHGTQSGRGGVGCLCRGLGMVLWSWVTAVRHVVTGATRRR